MRKLRKLALIPVILGIFVFSAAPAFADFVCPVLPVSDAATAHSNANFITIAGGDTSVLPGKAGYPANSPVSVPDHATNGGGSGSPGGPHAVPGDSDYTATRNS